MLFAEPPEPVPVKEKMPFVLNRGTIVRGCPRTKGCGDSREAVIFTFPQPVVLKEKMTTGCGKVLFAEPPEPMPV